MAILSPEMQGYIAVMTIFALVVPIFYKSFFEMKDDEDNIHPDDFEEEPDECDKNSNI